MVIIEGEVWAPADEPTYLIQQMGFGNNHDGTLRSTDVGPAGSPSKDRFSILENVVAVAVAVQSAIDNGNDRSIPGINAPPAPKIYLPSAFKFPTRASRTIEAEAVRAKLATAAKLMTGAVTTDALPRAIELIEASQGLIRQHGLETVQVEERGNPYRCSGRSMQMRRWQPRLYSMLRTCRGQLSCAPGAARMLWRRSFSSGTSTRSQANS